jgi:hypothetical protein
MTCTLMKMYGCRCNLFYEKKLLVTYLEVHIFKKAFICFQIAVYTSSYNVLNLAPRTCTAVGARTLKDCAVPATYSCIEQHNACTRC